MCYFFVFYCIFSLNYPISQIEKHEQEINKLLPDVNKLSLLVQAARVLWKKWIVLKMVFKIPKLDRPKEGMSLKHDVIILYIIYCLTIKTFDNQVFLKLTRIYNI